MVASANIMKQVSDLKTFQLIENNLSICFFESINDDFRLLRI